mmetsp:Transcript_21086/g.43082  ORF Transcript_21086/g.43082 Transcript_21086/m.43082 type:complete len:215 (+) Transcript_21086:1300-1944(+)
MLPGTQRLSLLLSIPISMPSSSIIRMDRISAKVLGLASILPTLRPTFGPTVRTMTMIRQEGRWVRSRAKSRRVGMAKIGTTMTTRRKTMMRIIMTRRKMGTTTTTMANNQGDDAPDQPVQMPCTRTRRRKKPAGPNDPPRSADAFYLVSSNPKTLRRTLRPGTTFSPRTLPTWKKYSRISTGTAFDHYPTRMTTMTTTTMTPTEGQRGVKSHST